MSDLKSTKTRIRSAVKQQGNYTKDMEPAITLAAGSFLAFEKVVADIEELENCYTEEYSREGNVKLVPHPAFKLLSTTAEATRKSLRELGLTLSTLSESDNDEVSDLINEVEKARNED